MKIGRIIFWYGRSSIYMHIYAYMHIFKYKLIFRVLTRPYTGSLPVVRTILSIGKFVFTSIPIKIRSLYCLENVNAKYWSSHTKIAIPIPKHNLNQQEATHIIQCITFSVCKNKAWHWQPLIVATYYPANKLSLNWPLGVLGTNQLLW